MRWMMVAAAVVGFGVAACDREPGLKVTRTVEIAVGDDAVRAASDFATNEALIKALYAEPTIPIEPATIRKYFAEEFVAGLTPPEGDGGLIDFDYRINGQDGAADRLTITETDGDGANGRVMSRFTNMGAASEIAWTVCRQPDGALRVVGAKSMATDDTAWDLRDLLGLPPRAEGC